MAASLPIYHHPYMISVESLKVEFGTRPLFEDVSFSNKQERPHTRLSGKTEQANQHF